MEVHFVHQAEAGDLGVIGVFMTDGKSNSTIETIWQNIPEDGATIHCGLSVDAMALLPESPRCFRYAGSLTTPPCSEVVSWAVMADPVEISRAQIDTFGRLYPMNARPIQGLNRRFILSN